MMALFSFLQGFIGSLAVLAMLALVYGHLQRSMMRPEMGEGLMGFWFGLVAVVEMYMPIEPMPGLIIDLRNAPRRIWQGR